MSKPTRSGEGQLEGSWGPPGARMLLKVVQELLLCLWGDMVSRSMCGQLARPHTCPYQAGQSKGLEVTFTRHSLGVPRQTLTNKSSWKICRKLGISTGSICQWRGCSGRCEDPSGPSEAPSSWRSWIHCSGPGGPLFCLVFLLLAEYGFSGTQLGCWPQTHCSFHLASWFSILLQGIFPTQEANLNLPHYRQVFLLSKPPGKPHCEGVEFHPWFGNYNPSSCTCGHKQQQQKWIEREWCLAKSQSSHFILATLMLFSPKDNCFLVWEF